MKRTKPAEKSLPVFFRRTYSPTTRTMSACCFTLSANDPASAMGILYDRNSTTVIALPPCSSVSKEVR